MTGVVFVHILKHKEIEYLRNANNRKNKKGGKSPKQTNEESSEKSEKPQDVKNHPIVIKGPFPTVNRNKMCQMD